MALMLASVTGLEEAEIAIAGGADVVEFHELRQEAPGPLGRDAVRKAVQSIAGRAQVSAVAGTVPRDAGHLVEAAARIAETGVDFVKVGLFPAPERPDWIKALAPVTRRAKHIAALFVDHEPDFKIVRLLADCGFAGVALDTAGKAGGGLLAHTTLRRLEDFISLCRASRLITALAGSLEAPDVLRLLPLDPDMLGFRGALCRDHDRSSVLDPAAVAAIRRLIPRERPATSPDRSLTGELNRIFVRDLVVPMSIGAYRRERDRPQRVRFDVVAEVERRRTGSDEMAGVFSYDIIIDAIHGLAASGHVNLVETLAEQVAARVLQHVEVRVVTVRVEKLDVGPGGVGIEIVRRR